MNKSVQVLLLLLLFKTAFGQSYNRPIPDGVYPYEFNEIQTSWSGYILATHIKIQSTPNDPNYIQPYSGIYDQNGYLVWYGVPSTPGLVDFKYYETTNQYSFTTAQPTSRNTIVLDSNLNIIDTLETQNNLQDIHDVIRLSNGNWLLSSVPLDTADLSASVFDGTQGSAQTVLRGYGYEELDPNGNLVSEWNSNDHVDPTETYDFWGYNANNFDYCHGNAYEEDTDGHILVSYRHLNSIHKIHRQTGAIIWRLGGEQSDFSFSNDAGFSGQHDIRRLANGDVSLFDNANMGGASRGVTYQLDTINWIATKTSEYTHPDAFDANAMGSYRIQDDGIEIIGYGRTYRPFPSAAIIDENDNIISEFYFKDSVVSYRMIIAQLQLPQRPEISCDFNGANLELSVTTPHNVYAWSTGESSASIEITQPGTYQVWVDQGMGMLGSIPFTVLDINNPPCTVGIDEVTLNKGSFEWCTIMGQKIDNPKSGELYLKVFENGTVEKVIF